MESLGSKLDFNMFTSPTTLFVCSKHRSYFYNVGESFSHEVYDSCTHQQKVSCSGNFLQKKRIYVSVLYTSFLGVKKPTGMMKTTEKERKCGGPRHIDTEVRKREKSPTKQISKNSFSLCPGIDI